MKEREGYKPSECVKNVSISHCPPGRGEEMKVKKGGGGRWRKMSEINGTDGGDDCQRSGFPIDPAVRVQSDKNMLGFIYSRQSALF